jgi:hypothetical protein
MSAFPSSGKNITDFTDMFWNFTDSYNNFPSCLLAEKPSENVRTTNEPVSFHRHLKKNLFLPNPFVDIFIDVLLSLQAETYVKHSKRLSNICARKTRKEYNL